MHQLFSTRLSIFPGIILITTLGLKATAQPITGDQIKAQFIEDWQRAKAYTLDYLNTMPADKYSFRAVPGIRSFAQQMLHLADDNVFLLEDATGEKIAWNGAENSPTAQTKDSVVWYVTRSYDFAIESIKKLDAGNLGEIVKYGDENGPRLSGRATRFDLMLKAFEHQTHHRGQTTIYIRLLGIRPPPEKLF